MTEIHKMMLNLYSIISLSNITNAFMVTLHSNIKTQKGTILDSYHVIKLKKKKRKNGKRKNSSRRDRTLVACVINQQDNHYTTPTADSVSEIKYLYMHPCLLWETSDVKSSNCFQRCTARCCFQNVYFGMGSCWFGYFDRPKTYKIFQKMAPLDLIDKADYPVNTTFFI